MKKCVFYTISLFILVTNQINAQLLEINSSSDIESTYTPQELIENVLITGACAQVNSFLSKTNGEPDETTTKSYGYFKAPTGSTFPFEEGIILSSGSAYEAGNTTQAGTISTDFSAAGDVNLETALGSAPTYDATFIKFNFIPTSTTISFRYLMASEEYNQFYECYYADSFAFLLRPLGSTTYTNLAVIPETSDPVSTINIHPDVPLECSATNEEYFEGYNLTDTNFGGRTKVLTAQATVIPNQTYEIKLVIADQGDNSFDTAVFLDAGSFILDANLGEPKLTSTNNAACGTSVTLDANIVATSYKWFKDGVEIAGEVSQTYDANLGDGTYSVEATMAVGCVANDEIEVEFTSQPTATKPTDVVFCDDDNDGLMLVDFESLNSLEIENGQTNVTTTYYLSQTDADNDIDQLPNPYESDSTTIYARVENNDSSNCYATTSFEIEIINKPTVLDSASIIPIELCDDTSYGTDNDGYVTLDLTLKDSEILNGQSTTNFNIDYYTDATYSSIISDYTLFTNTISGGQTIYARVSNATDASCFADTSFEITVFELPVVNSVVQLVQCDDDTDSISLFNLTEANQLISSATNETITYYLTQTEAETGLTSEQITNFTAYENPVPTTSTVFARIENSNGCYRTSQIDLIVGSSQIPSTFSPIEYTVCDNELVDGDKRNGIATFDFSNAETQIEALFPTQDVTITFYNNEADALAEINAISNTSNHRNVGYPNTQNIYVRVDSNVANECVGLGNYVNLNVETLPFANTITIAAQCDDTPTDTEQVTTFDTSSLENNLLNGQTNVSVEYFNASGNTLTDVYGTAITSPFPTTFRTLSQIITARVTNNTTNACFDETEIEFIVDAAPVANSVTIAPACDDGDDDTDGYHEFDTSTIESTLLGSQTGMIVTYTDANGNALSSPLPNPFNTSTQTITAHITNSLNSSCVASTTIDFIVNPLPDFEVTTPQIVCVNNPTTLLIIDWESDVYTYNWFDENDNLLASNTTELNVIVGGLYSVTATNSFGCERTLDIQVNESDIATITEDDLTIVDDSENNSITIDTTNLGTGDYEFSLDDEDFGYQDDPYFENVSPGIHTIYVRDKNNCGLVSIEAAVIGFPKFFTPNNDGYNDTWTILGVNKNFYASVKVYIFDRFGKLITQFNTINSENWNGTYKGKILPSTDYWFKAQLVDYDGNIRVKSGHFSLIRN